MKYGFRPLIFLLFVSLASCSIQKRMYSNGYYVEWNHGKHDIDPPPLLATGSYPGNPEPSPGKEEESIVAASEAPVKSIAPAIVKLKHRLPQAEIKEDIPEVTLPVPKADDTLRKGVNPLAVASFSSALLSAFLFAIGITGSGVLLAIAAGLALTALIMGIIALKGPQYEKGKGLAIAGTSLGAVVLALLLLLAAFIYWVLYGFS